MILSFKPSGAKGENGVRYGCPRESRTIRCPSIKTVHATMPIIPNTDAAIININLIIRMDNAISVDGTTYDAVAVAATITITRLLTIPASTAACPITRPANTLTAVPISIPQLFQESEFQ